MLYFCGDDDPYVPLSFARELAGALCVEPVVVHKGGHLNADSGYTQFPQLLEAIISL